MTTARQQVELGFAAGEAAATGGAEALAAGTHGRGTPGSAFIACGADEEDGARRSDAADPLGGAPHTRTVLVRSRRAGDEDRLAFAGRIGGVAPTAALAAGTPRAAGAAQVSAAAGRAPRRNG